MDDVLRSPLERTLRRIAVTVPVLAVVATIVGSLPAGLVDSPCCGDAVTTPKLPTTAAGGWTLAGWTLLTIAIAYAVYQHPTRRRALIWSASAPISLGLALAAWSFEHDARHTSFGASDVGDAMVACIGAIAVLLLIALPVIVIASDGSPPSPTSPVARVVT